MVLPAAYLWLDTNARRVALLSLRGRDQLSGERVPNRARRVARGQRSGRRRPQWLDIIFFKALAYRPSDISPSVDAFHCSRRRRQARCAADDTAEVPRPLGSPFAFAHGASGWTSPFSAHAGRGRVSAVGHAARRRFEPRLTLAGELESATGRLETGRRATAVDSRVSMTTWWMWEVSEPDRRAPVRRGRRRARARAIGIPLAPECDLYVGYYHHQGKGRNWPATPAARLRQPRQTHVSKTESGTFELNEVVREKAGTRRGVLFWYDINGRIVPDIYRAKRYAIWDALTRRRHKRCCRDGFCRRRGARRASRGCSRACDSIRAERLMPVLQQHLPS